MKSEFFKVLYIVVIFTPIFYNVAQLTWQFLFAFTVFFPLGYYTIEFIDYLIPDTWTLREE